MKSFFKRNSHAWTLLYFFLYMQWFMWLENTITPDTNFTNLHVALDDMIPFCEYFIIPYLLWFLYIPLVLAVIFFSSRKEFYQASAYLFTGMSICLLICTLFPNGQDLRVESFERDNLFTTVMGLIYEADTNTNVFPSIHVFNSIGAFVILCKSSILRNRIWIKIGSGVLSILIILSTMFLKQHSVVDVIGGIILGGLMYIIVYVINWSRVISKKTEKTNRIDESKEISL